jgi:hypothetical protein
MSHFSRRAFLRGLSVGTTAIATGPGLGFLTEALSQNKGRTLGVALLGLGRYSTNHRMIAACKAAKVKLAVGYRLHYDLYHKEMMRLAQVNELR